MAVWFMRWLQGLPRQGLPRDDATLSRAEIATDAETPTNDRRDNVLLTRERAHALNYGGAID
jgi:hypothetical protein